MILIAQKRMDDMNFKLMAERTRYLKENSKGVSEMCQILEEMRTEALEEGRQEGIQEGRQVGMQEEKKQTVLRMLESGKYIVEEISNVSGLTPAEVEKLKTERTRG